MLIFNALFPVFACIALGLYLKRSGFVSDDLWGPMNRLAYYVFFPALLFSTMTANPIDLEVAGPMAGILAAAQISLGLFLSVLRRVTSIGGPAYTSVFQATVRWNGFVALAIIDSLYGAPGLALAAITFATMVPLANIMSITVLTRHASDEAVKPLKLIMMIATNPLIYSTLLGLAFNLAGLSLPRFLEATLDVLSGPALPLGLLGVGAALSLSAFKVSPLWLSVATGLKLAIMPLAVTGLAIWAGVTGIPLIVALCAAAVPTAAGGYVLAKEMGGDAELMAALITVSTLISAITLPLWLYVSL